MTGIALVCHTPPHVIGKPMDLAPATVLPALAGGVLIGLGTLIGAAASGIPPGISGLCAEILGSARGEVAWRAVFILGMVAGGIAVFQFLPASAAFNPPESLATMTAAGLLVGVGTRVGGGCTSGHGVCGIGLGSKRGFIATLLFMVVAMVTVYVVQHAGGIAR
jgi:uncharacterized membrane protein YedE/YeeE